MRGGAAAAGVRQAGSGGGAGARGVKVVTVGLQQMQSGFEFAGEVRSSGVESGVSGRGQDYQLAADAAKAQLAAAATNRDLAAADFKRYKELKELNFISGVELERRARW